MLALTELPAARRFCRFVLGVAVVLLSASPTQTQTPAANTPGGNGPRVGEQPAQSTAADFNCTDSTLRNLKISTAAHNAFSADAVFSRAKIQPDGTRKQMGDLSIFTVHIARDNAGLVAIKSPEQWNGWNVPKPGKKPVYWQQTICNPTAGTGTSNYEGRIGYWDAYVRPLRQMQASRSPFQRAHAGSREKWIDLGDKEIGGIRAHGYRWWRLSSKGDSTGGGYFTEEWISDDLDADLVRIEVNQAEGVETRAELVHVSRVEPPSKLFELPKGHIQVHPDTDCDCEDNRQPAPTVFSCSAYHLSFGTLEHSPFTAEVQITDWQPLPAGSGNKIRVDLGWQLSPDKTEEMRAMVNPDPIARDDAGRVSNRYPEEASDDMLVMMRPGLGLSADLEWAASDDQLCDPEAETVSSSRYNSSSASVRPLNVNRAYSMAPSTDPHRRRVDLGYKNIGGIRAHGYRWWYTSGGNFQDENGDFNELWVSEELKVEVLSLHRSKKGGKSEQAEIINLRRGEPDAKWFKKP